MASHGHIQKQFAELMATATSQSYKLEAVLPTEMQDHFRSTSALKDAQAYIKECEENEKQLKIDNATLAKRLQTMQAELDDQPQEIINLRSDLEQAEHRIAFYQQIAKDCEDRADRFERKSQQAIKSQQATEDTARRIERLERDLADREADIIKVLAAKNRLEDDVQAQRERDLALIKEKDEEIARLTTLTDSLQTERAEAFANADQTTETYESLTQVLEAETISAATELNEKAVRLHANEQLYAAFSSELAPINAFYTSAHSVLSVSQSFLKDLVDPTRTEIPVMPADLDKHIDAAWSGLEAFQNLAAAMQSESESLAQDRVLIQLNDMARGAGDIYHNLEGFHENLVALLGRLRENGGQFNKPGRPGSTIIKFIRRLR